MYRLRVGVVAMEATPWELEDNFQRMEAYVREAVRRRAELVIAPEAILDGYVCASDPDTTRERMLSVAQTVPEGPYIVRGSELARELGIYLIFGFLERAGDEMFNTCAMFSTQGEILGTYSKVHPTNESHITPGRRLEPIDTPIGRTGFLICSDRGVTDNFSTLGVQGAEIIFIPMDGSGGPPNTRTLQQRARDNHCWIVVANTWSSVIIGPDGETYLEKYESECVSVQRLFLSETPRGDDRTRFTSRRYDLYAPLSETFEASTHFDESGRPTPLEIDKRAEWLEELRESKGR